MFTKKKSLSIAIVISGLSPLSLQAQEPCDTLAGIGIIHDSENSALEQVKLFGTAQYQIGHIDGTDSSGNSFSDTHNEFRRIWLGADVKFLRGFLFKSVLSVTQGKNAATGDQDIEFQHFRNLYLSYDIINTLLALNRTLEN